MQKIFIIIIAFPFLFFPLEKSFSFCKMSQDHKCACSGDHTKHNCCKILKIEKELAIPLKVLEINLKLILLDIQEIIKVKKEGFFFEIYKILNIHSPPIFLKILNLLI